MTVRRARVGDAEAIAAIWNEVIRETLATFTTEEKDPAVLAEQITGAPQRWHVAERDGRVQGFACYFQFRGGPGYARTMEYTIHLGAAARGAGLGRALLRAVEAEARAEGVHALYGGVSGANPQAQVFHERMGFARLAVLPEVGRKWNRWIDLHLFQKFL